ncbi:MAG: glycosyl transferase [Micavibrio aeruginosavorus]|uniref:Glycosyl transferase n=1 Tax=Micavibrio aeruginosavorus TaxID=349221 RepID=A0A2W5FNL0_9BACT|nr:MAG: glycosyl transferase [Micavibrio aeruginosavorus]
MSKTHPVVLQIIPHLGAGGAEQGCIDVAAELVRAGATSIVVSNGGHRVPELTRAGSTHVTMPVHSKNPFIMWRNTRRLRKLIEKEKVDIVHARSRAPAWSAFEACKGTPAHYMTTCHAPYNIHDKKLKRFYNSSISRGERVIAISEYVADYLRENYGVDDSKIRLIHRGIAPEKFHPSLVTAERMIKLSKNWRIPDGATVILLPGRLTRWKGHTVLIDAMSKIGRKDLFCVFVGADQGRSEYHAELEKLIAEKGLGEQIRIMGHCDDMSAAYMISTIIVSASIEPEGFGRVAVEGQAMGRIVIATDHGGSKETIIPDETGFLVPINDADALAEKIKQALSMPEEEKYMMAERAMNHVHANFTRQIMVNKTIDVYAELLA